MASIVQVAVHQCVSRICYSSIDTYNTHIITCTVNNLERYSLILTQNKGSTKGASEGIQYWAGLHLGDDSRGNKITFMRIWERVLKSVYAQHLGSLGACV